MLASDNGTQLTSQEFSNFLTANGIRHIKTASFHPSSNGQDLPLIRRLSNFLLHYRRVPHALTKQSPAELFLGRPIRSRLDCLKPQERDVTFVKESSSTKFNIGDLDNRPHPESRWFCPLFHPGPTGRVETPHRSTAAFQRL